ncbi:30S ribosomal protein S8 [Candidatus Woesearchaeota archaeon]|nr:30S ribosomal protein S8 [Candidatus Woesearchaeota archaeon]
MSLNDPLANTLSKMLNAERRGKKMVVITPVSKMIKSVLSIMQDNHYIGAHEEVTPEKGGVVKVALLGMMNACGAIRPRYQAALEDYERFEKRYLLAKDFGVLIVSTSRGVMTHAEAKKKGIGGRLLAYCY